MSDQLVVLACKNCGGKIRVHENMNRFSCGYCGTELMVQRSESGISLSLLRDAIARVQIGTDKTAAELALSRYTLQLQQITPQLQKLEKTHRNETGCAASLGLILVFFALDRFGTSDRVNGVLCASIGIVLLIFAFARKKRKELLLLEENERNLEALIEEKRRIAES